ncbi:MAG: type VI secretion protein IcmF/TssM N-terminal domain-containing protein [Planctomycetota bacterium]
MKRFYQTFKALPPEFKVVLGFLGLGTMAGLFYLLQRQVGGRTPMLIIIGVVAVLALLVWLVIRLFGWTGRRRAARMDYELSSGEQGGPQSMDVSAKIKANNEKFFKAVRELKKTVGISVYELPWYIVIGDSGCGKTKLVNEGGLTFSTGKPEGYQLGTLDYNWWFTEDAIFIDMAGRLCNPQDDRDRREWMAFLDTIARGRKGYPINGALVCVSTEHLLRDPPEKHESDAHIALERLRDLQSKLGVTFATYLVVTKCDKILGFMQFFDRAERDIAVKNQIFGWSRPGTFNEPYDPEKFKGDFSKLYGTLNDLRLRRMNDDAEEIDLGLACAFPEEFRGLFDPLQTYIRTLFPFIRNPRAVKNLLFRGVYFTSATQEGELILKHLTERLGNEAASQFPPARRPVSAQAPPLHQGRAHAEGLSGTRAGVSQRAAGGSQPAVEPGADGRDMRAGGAALRRICLEHPQILSDYR